MKRVAFVLGTAVLLIAGVANSTTRIQQIAPNRFLVTHQKQSGLGGQGKALRKSYEKAASLCVAAGYKWFEIVETQSTRRKKTKTSCLAKRWRTLKRFQISKRSSRKLTTSGLRLLTKRKRPKGTRTRSNSVVLI